LIYTVFAGVLVGCKSKGFGNSATATPNSSLSDSRTAPSPPISDGADPPSTTRFPPDRSTAWSPGVPGGCRRVPGPAQNVSSATYGARDATAGIQAAIEAHPVVQVAQLSAGNFNSGNLLLIERRSPPSVGHRYRRLHLDPRKRPV